MGNRRERAARPPFRTIAPMSLYLYPELYDAIRRPPAEFIERSFRWISEYLDGPFESVMDPACGPANWLAPFSDRGLRVAGNDLCEEMVEAARRRLPAFRAEVVRGNMCDLRFQTGPFDVALELAGSVGILLGEESVVAMLRSVSSHLRPGGLFMLTFFRAEDTDTGEAELWRGETPLPGGALATVVYSIVDRCRVTRRETIRREVRVAPAGPLPERLRDEYAVRTWGIEELATLVESATDLRVVGVRSFDERDGDGGAAARVDLEPVMIMRKAEPAARG